MAEETEDEQRLRWAADDNAISQMGRPGHGRLDQVTREIQMAIDVYDNPWTPGIRRELVHAYDVLTEWEVYTWPAHDAHEVDAATCEVGDTCVLHASSPPDDTENEILDTVMMAFRLGYGVSRHGWEAADTDIWADRAPARIAAYEAGVALGALVASGQVSEVDEARI